MCVKYGYDYDSLGRLIHSSALEDGATTQVASIKYLKPGTSVAVMPQTAYSYDALGNISKIEVAGRNHVEYTYDVQNQLIQEKEGNVVNSYSYDTYGNIRSIKTVQCTEIPWILLRC